MTTNEDYKSVISTALNLVTAHGGQYGGLRATKKHLQKLRDALEENRVHIEPPEPEVEVFGPGDVLRVVGGDPNHIYFLGEKKYYYASGSGYTKTAEYQHGSFTSVRFERVENLNDDSE